MGFKMRSVIASLIITTFISTSVNISAFAQMSVDPMPWMSKPGAMVPLSQPYTPAYLKGIMIHPKEPFNFDFIIHKGDKPLTDTQKRQEYTKLTKYFLASLAIPDDDQWVNLSPYEKNRIIKDDFGKTEMGRDLLAQDYMLKQITASLIYPEDQIGKKFWDKVYAAAKAKYGTTDVYINTFNKVWILPDDALIYEKGNVAYVLKNHLRVMLEEDYLSLQKHLGIESTPTNKTHSIASRIVRQIVLPELQKEVNEGANFSPLRQVYSGMLLATWFKRTLKESLLGQIYMNKAKVKGVDQDPRTNEEIYRQYLRAYKKGVFNFIKEDTDRLTHETMPRKYFSGGTGDYAMAGKTFGHDVVQMSHDNARGLKAVAQETPDDEVVQEAFVKATATRQDAAMLFELRQELNLPPKLIVEGRIKKVVDYLGNMFNKEREGWVGHVRRVSGAGESLPFKEINIEGKTFDVNLYNFDRDKFQREMQGILRNIGTQFIWKVEQAPNKPNNFYISNNRKHIEKEARVSERIRETVGVTSLKELKRSMRVTGERGIQDALRGIKLPILSYRDDGQEITKEVALDRLLKGYYGRKPVLLRYSDKNDPNRGVLVLIEADAAMTVVKSSEIEVGDYIAHKSGVGLVTYKSDVIIKARWKNTDGSYTEQRVIPVSDIDQYHEFRVATPTQIDSFNAPIKAKQYSHLHMIARNYGIVGRLKNVEDALQAGRQIVATKGEIFGSIKKREALRAKGNIWWYTANLGEALMIMALLGKHDLYYFIWKGDEIFLRLLTKPASVDLLKAALTTDEKGHFTLTQEVQESLVRKVSYSTKLTGVSPEQIAKELKQLIPSVAVIIKDVLDHGQEYLKAFNEDVFYKGIVDNHPITMRPMGDDNFEPLDAAMSNNDYSLTTDVRLPDAQSARTGLELAQHLRQGRTLGFVESMGEIGDRDTFVFLEASLIRGDLSVVIAINEFEKKFPDLDVSKMTGEGLIRLLYSTGALKHVKGSEVPDIVTNLDNRSASTIVANVSQELVEAFIRGEPVSPEAFKELVNAGALSDGQALIIETSNEGTIRGTLELATTEREIKKPYPYVFIIKQGKKYSGGYSLGKILSIKSDAAMLNVEGTLVRNPQDIGGIDLNPANLNLRIKRDGHGMPLPFTQQDLAQLSNLQGLDPVILSIKPASQTPLWAELTAH